MSGKLAAIAILVISALAGAAIYYLQVWGFYYEVPARAEGDVMLVSRQTGQSEPIPYAGFQAIDADSSPIRYRACFTTGLEINGLERIYEPVPKAEPRNGPFWFDCFDAEEIGAELAAGTARAFLSVKNVEFGVDRIVVITDDGRGFAWHDLNNCGEKAYDGSKVGEDCPPRPQPGN